MVYLIIDIEILSQGIASGRHSAIVWLEDGVIEVGQVGARPLERHDLPNAVDDEDVLLSRKWSPPSLRKEQTAYTAKE